MEILIIVIGIILGSLIIVVPAILILKICDKYQVWADNAMDRIIEASTNDISYDEIVVDFQFTLYYGFFNMYIHKTYEFSLPYTNAKIMLKKFHHFNLKWAWFSPYILLGPINSFCSYWNQKRKIKKQYLQQGGVMQ